jgi:hypothetical protein
LIESLEATTAIIECRMLEPFAIAVTTGPYRDCARGQAENLIKLQPVSSFDDIKPRSRAGLAE